MQTTELDRYRQRVQTLVGQGKLQEAMALAHWVNGVQNQQSLRLLQEGMSTGESTTVAVFTDSHPAGWGETNQLVALSLAPGSATYLAVMDLIRAQFAFIPDGTPEPKVGG